MPDSRTISKSEPRSRRLRGGWRAGLAWVARGSGGGAPAVLAAVLALGVGCAGQDASTPAPDEASPPAAARGEPTPSATPAPDDAAPRLSTHLATRGRQLSVQLRVNGEGPYLFTLDTGSAMTVCIDQELARTLALPTVGEVLNSDASSRVVLRPLVRVDALEIGGHDFGEQRALVADYRFVSGEGDDRVMGILGLPLFATGVVTLDAPGETLSWGPGALRPAEHVVPYTLPDGIPEVDLRVGGRELRAVVDTGFVGAVSLPASLRGSFRERGEAVLVGSTRGPNGGPGSQVWGLALDEPLHVAGHVLDAPDVWFIEGRGEPYLGGRLLRRYVLRFDLDRRLMELAPPRG